MVNWRRFSLCERSPKVLHGEGDSLSSRQNVQMAFRVSLRWGKAGMWAYQTHISFKNVGMKKMVSKKYGCSGEDLIEDSCLEMEKRFVSLWALSSLGELNTFLARKRIRVVEFSWGKHERKNNMFLVWMGSAGSHQLDGIFQTKRARPSNTCPSTYKRMMFRLASQVAWVPLRIVTLIAVVKTSFWLGD